LIVTSSASIRKALRLDVRGARTAPSPQQCAI
jgi:hypothetical protein